MLKPPTPTFPLNPNKQSWSKWEWHDVVAKVNWKGYENKLFDVEVYSSCEQVELFLNAKSLRKRETNHNSKNLQLPGKCLTNIIYIKAVEYIDSKQVTTSELKTAGNAVNEKLICQQEEIKASGRDLSYISGEINC